MSWIFGLGRQQPQQPDTTSLEQARERQIQSLHKHNHPPAVNVIQVSRHVDYRVEFKSGSQQLRLMIQLPSEFPRIRPFIRVDPPVSHSWIDSQMNVVGCRALNEFKMHSDLGKVVHEIVTEFQRSPPQPSHSSFQPYPPHQQLPPLQQRPPLPSHSQSYPMPGYPSQPRLPMPAPAAPGNQVHPYPTRPAPAPPPPTQRRSSQFTYNAPAIPINFAELRDMSIEELGELSTKPEKILEFIENLPAVKKLHDDRAELNSEIEDQAKINLEKEPEIQEKVEKLTEQHEILSTVKRSFEDHQQQHLALCQQYSNETVLTNLSVEVQKIDEESETVAEGFLSGELDVDEFVKQYTDKRKVYHCRKAKEEKLQKTVQRQW